MMGEGVRGINLDSSFILGCCRWMQVTFNEMAKIGKGMSSGSKGEDDKLSCRHDV